MRVFHQSRGRILFEVFCALAISASFAGAWVQTGSWALLPAAAVSLLYSLVHAFDMSGPARADVPQVTDQQSDLFEYAGEQAVVTDDQAADGAVEQAELIEPTPPKAKAPRRSKTPRKGSGRRAKAPKEAEVAEAPVPGEPKVLDIMPPEQTESPEEVAHAPVIPLFESEPFVRQQRAVFGRKAG